MDNLISATELARKLGDILGRIRYRGERFVVERNGEAIATLGPLPSRSTHTLRDALASWSAVPGDAGDFASDLERVNRADRPAEDPWGS